jgi:hypothetical protein
MRRWRHRAAVLRDPLLASGVGQFGAVQAAASSIGMELTPVGVRDVGEMERAIAALASSPNGSLIVMIVSLAAHHKLPAIAGEPGRPPSLPQEEGARRIHHR